MPAEDPEDPYACLPGTAPRVVKDEREARVELRQTSSGEVVVKTYRNFGMHWWQTFGRQSRAARECANLRTIAALGVPCTPPVGFTEVRHGCFVDSSTLVTRHLADAASLKQVLHSLDRQRDAQVRGRLAAAAGALLRQLHAGGILWSTPMPRNVLVLGPPAAARLAVCDVPNAMRFAGSLVGKSLARIDLFRAAFSPSRRRDWSRGERWRWLVAYTAGDRVETRRLWRDLARTTTMGTELRRSLSAVRSVYLARKTTHATAR